MEIQTQNKRKSEIKICVLLAVEDINFINVSKNDAFLTSKLFRYVEGRVVEHRKVTLEIEKRGLKNVKQFRELSGQIRG